MVSCEMAPHHHHPEIKQNGRDSSDGRAGLNNRKVLSTNMGKGGFSLIEVS